MKKLLLVGALTLSAASCAPDIKQDPAPDVVVAQFDPAGSPAVVPTPNDLAIDPATGLVNAPINPDAPAAEQEFTKDYINTLNGFPTSVSASTTIVGLDKSTVKPSTVLFLDLLKGTPIATPSVTPEIAYDPETSQIVIRPPAATGWPKGGRYAVALIGGDNGLKGAQGEKVVGSPVWALASLQQPLVTCEDLTAPDCKPTTDLIPAESTDPVEHLKEQTASALQLEQLRRAYAPLLDAVANQGVKREDIVLLWTFRIMNMPEATFNLDPINPANSIVPFPNNLLLGKDTAGNQHVNLPVPSNASPLQQQLIAGLNTLDGFSTTAPSVSENSDTKGVIDTGSRLDANSLTAGTKFVKLTPGGTQPNVKACLNCASSSTSSSNPQQLQFVPQVPLDEKSTYAAVMTTDLKDERGRFLAPPSSFALLRLSNPLSVEGKSQVSVVSDAQAAALEQLRLGFKPMFDALAQANIPRSKVALAWAFTTQSTVSIQKTLAGLPSAVYGPKGLPEAPIYLVDVTTQITAPMQAAGLPVGNIGKVFQGSVVLPFLLTGTGGTLNPNAPRFERALFLLALPTTAAPTTGYPVTIFSHGLKSSRTTATAIINALAGTGHATIAIDTVFHGERSTCAGITATSGISGVTTPDAACNTGGRCDVDPASVTFGRCISDTRNACDPSPTATVPGDIACTSANQGRCVPTSATDPTAGICEGSSFKTDSSGVPLISGWNLLNLTNLFATRDNFRQHTVDHSQLERVLVSTKTGNINDQLALHGAGKLDSKKIDYIGQSLGGILGPLYTAASPNVRHAVFNVPGGDLTGILLTSPAFAAARTGFLGTLSSQGINAGTPAFDQFIGLAKMILDPADPINYSYSVENGSVPAGRQAFIQYIENDQVVPNTLTEELIAAANNRATTQNKVDTFKFTPTTAELALDKRHGFLLDFSGNPAVTNQAQTQAIQFLDTGTLPAP